MNVYDLLVKHEMIQNNIKDLSLKTNSWMGRDSSLWDSISKQQARLREIEEQLRAIRIYKYQVDFGCTGGSEGIYLADTIEDLYRKIDDDSSIDEDFKDILKYGYFREFREKDIGTKQYTIDNCMSFFWRVNY